MSVTDPHGRGPYKPKSERIDWAYHLHLHAARRALAVGGVVVVLGVAWAGASWFRPLPLDRYVSPGPLARAHQAWDDDCAKCHVPFTAVGSAGGSERCAGCHAGTPAHHPNEASAPACAECHLDHQGRGGLLTRPADTVCTRCHSDLTGHRKEGAPVLVSAGIRGFADPGHGHPEFRPLAGAARKRTLKFSHAVHLTPGMAVRFSYSQIGDRDQKRYLALGEKADPAAEVKLTCAACHAADAGRTEAADRPAAEPTTPAARFFAAFDLSASGLPREALHPPRAPGRNHLPVVYEAHCRACHPLGFDDALRGVEVPHRLQPPGVASFLRRVYAEQWVTDGLPGLPASGAANDRLDPRDAAVPAPPATVGAAIAARVAGTEAVLYGERACLKCHTADMPPPVGGVVRPPSRIIPGNIPSVWLPTAAFSHAAHRHLSCGHCHATARGAADAPFRHRPDLPGIESCRSCHSPAGGAVRGCTDCHTYHGIDRPLQGVGARIRPGR